MIRARAAITMIAHSVTQIANGTRRRCMFGQKIKRGEVFCTTQKTSGAGMSIGNGMSIAVVGVVGHGGILTDSIGAGEGLYFRYAPAAPPRDTPAKLASRMKRRWRVVLLRHKGEILGTVEAADVASKAAAAVQFGLDEVQRTRIIVQEYA